MNINVFCSKSSSFSHSFSWLWSFILHLCELSLREQRCSISRLPHSLRTKALSCWRAPIVSYVPSHVSQLQIYEIGARFFFFFSIFQIRKLRLKMFGKLSQVTQPINIRVEISIQESKDPKTKTVFLRHSKKTFSCYKRSSDRVLPCL